MGWAIGQTSVFHQLIKSRWTFCPRLSYVILSISKPHISAIVQAVVCAITPKMYPCSGYFLVSNFMDFKKITGFSICSCKTDCNDMYVRYQSANCCNSITAKMCNASPRKWLKWILFLSTPKIEMIGPTDRGTELTPSVARISFCFLMIYNVSNM